MTSKRQKDAGYPLPENHLPEDTYCVQFEIPRALEYRQAIVGHLALLGKWWSWQKSYTPADTRAKEAAELWRVLLEGLQISDDCQGTGLMFELRQSATDPCLLEQTLDGGVTWSPAFDYSECLKNPPNVLTRWTAGGRVEKSYDGGVTWENGDDLDPRFNAPLMPPIWIPPEADTRCTLANNVTAFLKQEADKAAADGGAWASVGGLVSALIGLLIVVGIIGTGAVLTPALIAMAAAMMAFTAEGFAAAMTENVYDAFNCLVYCRTPENGLYDEAAWEGLKADIADEFTGVALVYIWNSVNLWGPVGLINASRTVLGGERDCTECACSLCVEDQHVWMQHNPDNLSELEYVGTRRQVHSNWTGFLSICTSPGQYAIRVNYSSPKCVNKFVVWNWGSSTQNYWKSAYWEIWRDGKKIYTSNTVAFKGSAPPGFANAQPTNWVLPQMVRGDEFWLKAATWGTGTVNESNVVHALQIEWEEHEI